MPDSRANFGESLKAFCDKNGYSCSRTDTDMSSNEEITRFDAEKNNPIAVMADIGLLYGPVAEAKSVLMDWVLTDEGQTIFAKFGARPIRYVLGDLQLPAEVRAKWLPDEAYRDVQQVKDWAKTDPSRIAELWDREVLTAG